MIGGGDAEPHGFGKPSDYGETEAAAAVASPAGALRECFKNIILHPRFKTRPLIADAEEDGIGLPLTACDTEEVSALGAAVLAMSFATSTPIETTAGAMASLGDTSVPDPAGVALYSELSLLQARLYDRLADINAAQYEFGLRHPLG